MKAICKLPIVFVCSFVWSLQMMLTGPSRLFLNVPLHQESVYVFICKPFSTLMNCLCAFAQCQSSDSEILSNYDISGMALIDQGNVHGIRSSSYYFDNAVIRSQYVIRVTQQNNRDPVLF